MLFWPLPRSTSGRLVVSSCVVIQNHIDGVISTVSGITSPVFATCERPCPIGTIISGSVGVASV